ncbi:Ribose-5-phosphate isomerase A [Jannaschia seosinensis]|uniref:Ribose-5-phosphate isomerase A n=1 Tax=Jannaschia seosinensis TaxID=313367 RepID=A0A0M7BET7_9RHOB|nr:ribose-5-phosphate isomerase RpiA [Jannaschia seosinensis]CUH40302.1 Ribose-5-phosphate isomerase A [Jannaschia seosinensis]
MSAKPDPIDMAKYVSALRALDYVQDGMRIGLGTGSTAAWMVRGLGERVRRDGLRVTGVPTSSRTASLARECGIQVITLEDAKWLDLTIDGADEFDPGLGLIKGGGGALLQEKIVATASDMMVVITDSSKAVDTLGAFPLPVEVIPFGWQTTKALIEESLIGMDVAGRQVTLRLNRDAPYRTDEGNLILDLHLRRIGNARQLSLMLNQIPGVVENGLFLDICDVLITGEADGGVEVHDGASGTVTHERMEMRNGGNIFTNDAG